jgi:hypothetical protein
MSKETEGRRFTRSYSNIIPDGMSRDEFELNLFDIFFFAENVLGNTIKEFHREWLTGVRDRKRIAIIGPRGFGKTYSCIITYYIWKAYTQPGWEGIIISKSERQAKKVVREIRKLMMNNELLYSSLPKAQLADDLADFNKTDVEITNESRILCRPANEAVLGEHPHCVAIDEGAKFEVDDDWFESTVTPIVHEKQGQIILISTPEGMNGFFYKAITSGVYTVITTPALGKDGHSVWPDKFSDEYLTTIRTEIGERMFQKEYQCDFASQEGQVFPDELVQACIGDKNHRFLLNHPYPFNDKKVRFMGVDWAQKRDYTVMVIVEKNVNNDGPIEVINITRLRKVPWQALEHKFEEVFNLYLPRMVFMDATTIGSELYDKFRSRGLPILNFNFTKDKGDLVKFSQALLEGGGVELPNSPELIDEFKCYWSTVTKQTQREKFGAIRGHDDIVTALLLALKAAGRPSLGDIETLIRTKNTDSNIDRALDVEGYGDNGLEGHFKEIESSVFGEGFYGG